MELLAFTESFPGYLTDTAALAAIALIGYLFGKRTERLPTQPTDIQLYQELSRAAKIATDMQQIAGRIRQDVALHQSNISRFKARVSNLGSKDPDDGWNTLSSEAETLLTPTMKLATDLSQAYDEMRKQSLQLMNFAGSRTDPETGLHNCRALEEQLEVQFSLHEKNANRFSLALFSFDCSLSGEKLQKQLLEFSSALQSCARDTDIVARYSKDEFVVLMPQTSLSGGAAFSERLIRQSKHIPQSVIAGGIVEVQEEDDAAKLLTRADSALYSARTKGYNCIYKHVGKSVREHEMDERDEQVKKRADQPSAPPADTPASVS